MLFGIGVKAFFYYGHTENVESEADPRHHAADLVGHRRHDPGVVIMLVSRPYFKEFFSRKTETAPPGDPRPAAADRAGPWTSRRRVRRHAPWTLARP